MKRVLIVLGIVFICLLLISIGIILNIKITGKAIEKTPLQIRDEKIIAITVNHYNIGEHDITFPKGKHKKDPLYDIIETPSNKFDIIESYEFDIRKDEILIYEITPTKNSNIFIINLEFINRDILYPKIDTITAFHKYEDRSLQYLTIDIGRNKVINEKEIRNERFEENFEKNIDERSNLETSNRNIFRRFTEYSNDLQELYPNEPEREFSFVYESDKTVITQPLITYYNDNYFNNVELYIPKKVDEKDENIEIDYVNNKEESLPKTLEEKYQQLLKLNPGVNEFFSQKGTLTFYNRDNKQTRDGKIIKYKNTLSVNNNWVYWSDKIKEKQFNKVVLTENTVTYNNDKQTPILKQGYHLFKSGTIIYSSDPLFITKSGTDISGTDIDATLTIWNGKSTHFSNKIIARKEVDKIYNFIKTKLEVEERTFWNNGNIRKSVYYVGDILNDEYTHLEERTINYGKEEIPIIKTIKLAPNMITTIYYDRGKEYHRETKFDNSLSIQKKLFPIDGIINKNDFGKQELDVDVLVLFDK